MQQPNNDNLENTAPAIDFIELLQLKDFPVEQQELGLREFRIRGIDIILKELKKQLNKDEQTAFNRYLRMCPKINALTAHILAQYPESRAIFESYIPKLHTKIPTLE